MQNNLKSISCCIVYFPIAIKIFIEGSQKVMNIKNTSI